MSLNAKIVSAAANIALLVVAFMTPSSASPLITAISVLAASSNALVEKEEYKDASILLMIYTGLAAIDIIGCVILGFCGTIQRVIFANCYVYVVNSNLAFGGGSIILYQELTVLLLVFPIALVIAELALYAMKEKRKIKFTTNECPDGGVEK